MSLLNNIQEGVNIFKFNRMHFRPYQHDDCDFNRYLLTFSILTSLYLRISLGTQAGVTQLARVTAFQAVGRGFEPRLPLLIVICQNAISCLHSIKRERQESLYWANRKPAKSNPGSQ